ncbi:Uncharacterised protein [Chlamydia abortus]|nr:Uncharacterised protein [Chlamydia abortus]
MNNPVLKVAFYANKNLDLHRFNFRKVDSYVVKKASKRSRLEDE